MSISSISNYSNTLSIASLYGTQETDSDSDVISVLSSSTTSKSDSVDISKPSEMCAKLQELAKSDPEKLKKVCGEIAKELKSASQDGSGSGNKMLSELADKFQSAADGGDVSQLKPPEPPSFSGKMEPPTDCYSKQQQSGMAELMVGKSGQAQRPDDVLSSIMSKIDEALAE